MSQEIKHGGENAPDRQALARLIQEVLKFEGLPLPTASDLEIVTSVAEGRRAGIRGIDTYVQLAPHPIEPLSTPNWTPQND